MTIDSTPWTHHVLIGSLAAALPGADRIDLGVGHPAHAGILELLLAVDDGRITAAEPQIGAMHRGVEKLFEVREYRQILMLADRHDWQAPFIGELAAAQLFERMMGLPVPPRAAALRVLLAEHARVTAHLGQLTWLAAGTDQETAVREARERLRQVLVEMCGNRVHPMLTRLGGLAVDPSPAAVEELTDALAHASHVASELAVPEDLHHIATVPDGAVDAWGLSGPLARATGVESDLRLIDPQYAEVTDLLRNHADEGDAAARWRQIIGEIGDSAAIIARLAPLVPDGTVETKLPKIVKLPEGTDHHLVEGPLGRTGFRVVSRGQKTPWRMKLRSPSFQHVAALGVILPGTPVARLDAALASVGWVIGDVDK